MQFLRSASKSVLVVPFLLLLTATASATTLVHRSLDRLTSDNETIVEATVLDIHSYWNPEHTFIFTDVHARLSQVLKGLPGDELSFTVMGGSVGPTTTLIVGGPDLAPGLDYVLFLARTDLPGAPDRLTIRDLCQGVFDVQDGRAFSQARGELLLPDAMGRTEVPGGDEGIALDRLTQQILELR